MTTYYVNKSGNDSNDGLTPGTAKLTVQAAVTLAGATAAGAPHTVKVGSGVYSEAITVTGSTAGAGSMTIEGDGAAILDGGGSLGVGIYVYNLYVDLSSVYVRKLAIRNYTSSALACYRSGGIANYLNAYDCTISENANGAYPNSKGQIYLYRCLLVENANAVYVAVADANAASTCYNCTFHNNTVAGKKVTGSTGAMQFYDCSFTGTSGQYAVDLDEKTRYVGAYNLIRFTTDGLLCRIATTDYSTLANWKTACSSDATSIDSDPMFVDRANYLLRPKSGSPLLTSGYGYGNGFYTPTIGYCNRASIGISNNENSALWTGGDFSNAALDGSGRLMLATPGSGYLRTDVLDLGSVQKIRKLNISGVIAPYTIIYPGTVVDYDKTDSAPNRANFRFRGSNSSFLKGDGVIPWQTAEIGDDLSALVARQYRYWQFEITLRDDGVAA